jgi:predicted DNA-binding transcriptional regulator AlpA
VDADSSLIPRAELLKKFQISDASERRRRSGAVDWPPHVLIGKKIYYRRSQIDAWLRRREAESVVRYAEAES